MEITHGVDWYRYKLQEEIARAEAAEAEVEIQREAAVHYHEQWTAAEARVAALESEVGQLQAKLADCWTMAQQEREKAQAEAERLRAQVDALGHDTCSCCDRPVNRKIDACVCDWCYEDKLQ